MQVKGHTNFLNLMESTKYIIRQIKNQGHTSNQKPRSHHDVAYLQTATNVPTKYQLPTPYSFRYTAQAFIGQGHYSQVKGQIKVTP